MGIPVICRKGKLPKLEKQLRQTTIHLIMPQIAKYFTKIFRTRNIWQNTVSCNWTNSRALISNMTIVFQNCCPKPPNEAILVPNLGIFFGRNFAVSQI